VLSSLKKANDDSTRFTFTQFSRRRFSLGTGLMVEFRAPRPLRPATHAVVHMTESPKYPANSNKQTNKAREIQFRLASLPENSQKVVFIHVLVSRSAAAEDNQTWKREIEKRLNHLMSALNDAWRYLDLCFVPSALAARFFLPFVSRTRRWREGQDTESCEGFFPSVDGGPPTGRDSSEEIRCSCSLADWKC
jgi:hypothetical protein